MKRTVVVALAALLGACSLFIDPDELVSGNGAPADGDGGAPPGTGADGAAPFDGGFTLPDGGTIPSVPGCVPAPPAGTEGPYAVITNKFSASCPAGYLRDPVLTAKGDLAEAPATCNDASGCSCGPAQGTASCGFRMRYYDDSQCKEELAQPSLLSAACTQIPAIADYMRAELVAAGVTCTASGSAAPTAKPIPKFDSESLACAPDPKLTTAQCPAGSVALFPTFNALACVLSKSGSCPSEYPIAHDLSKDGKVDDQRGCSCACAVDPQAACTGGSIGVHSDNDCQNAAMGLGPGTCRLVSTADSLDAVLPSIAGAPSCTPAATPSGTLTPVNDVKLCCLK